MSEWRLRRASRVDAPAAAMVATASFLCAFYEDLAVADMLAHCAKNNSPEKFAEWIADAASVVRLAEHPETNAPIGYTVLTAPELPVPPRAGDIELKRIYLLPPAWGTGLAGRLVELACDDARALGHDRILLGVYGKNFRAHRFYEKQGFALAGTRQFQVGATLHDDFIYARSL